ncbi:hypothetical protein MSG28_008667 [Choristoneura fumiferana]|uniref:Uncharacterized protein n=1 Tax=Choristoneura fumiferana TaxID=7141 RepID=A0ACC0J7K1_CHOFU|nr:hypothetical protein MSG28_008667 [Choristoneura fumiferana]
MDTTNVNITKTSKMCKSRFSLRTLRLSLKFRPEIMKLVLKMRHRIKKKTRLLNILKQHLKTPLQTTNASTQTENDPEEFIQDKIPTKYKEDESIVNHEESKHQNAFTQTDVSTNLSNTSQMLEVTDTKTNEVIEISNLECPKEQNIASDENKGWKLSNENSDNGKSIAEQVKEAAQSAMQQSGMVYIESAGMYYDYKTGYYYSSELGLYYHPDTGCYYHYSEDKQTFEFHSYPDRSQTATNALYEAHEKKKARKLRKGKEDEQGSKAKRRKKSSKKGTENGEDEITEKETKEKETDADSKEIAVEKEKASVSEEAIFDDKDKHIEPQDLEEGECSESDNEQEDEKETDAGSESDVSVSTVSDADNDDSIAKHHPPSMRVIVRETNLPKLKVGSLFLVTKDGGTVGREGSSHSILIEDSNVSRSHLDIKYDMIRSIYTVTDLGSKNGTTLNGVRISESQIVSEPVEVMHGSIIQLGETKLLCHIHPGIDTCGHCEPGLVMEMQEKEKKVAYTRTCSVKKQHELELARLKNKYAPKPLAIEETAYNDRAKERRDKVGSSHHSEKTQSSDLETFIAPENKGFKLLEKMGWSKGEGLGKDNQGDTEPLSSSDSPRAKPRTDRQTDMAKL